jgi:hypothetical protein
VCRNAGIPACAAGKQPLLQEGKHALFQRVLTYPGCQLSAKAGEAGKEQPAFSRFYVYQRTTLGQDTWLQVGPDSFGHTAGWMKSSCTVDWKMQLTLAFTNPAGRQPMLFFKEKSDVESLLNSKNPAATLQPMLNSLSSHKPVPQVLAREPDYMVDQLKTFISYLFLAQMMCLPIPASRYVYSTLPPSAKSRPQKRPRPLLMKRT